MTTGMDDPFLLLHGNRPSTTTIFPDRDIDFIFTWKIDPRAVSTLQLNIPAHSNRPAICLDVDLKTLLRGKYGTFSPPVQQKLTSQNVKARTRHLDFLHTQWKEIKFQEQAIALHNNLVKCKIRDEQKMELQILDKEITATLLHGKQPYVQLQNNYGIHGLPNRQCWKNIDLLEMQTLHGYQNTLSVEATGILYSKWHLTGRSY
jgi:hypothetical protein